jgi:hypothetical protein
MMEAEISSETTVTNYQSIKRHIQQDFSLHQQRCENLKLRFSLYS